MAKKSSSQPKISSTKRSSSKSQPKPTTLGGHARRIASQPSLGGNRKRR